MISNIKEPLVSIIMNCYNGEKYLKQAIQSILSQKYQNWEIVFWDNQSTDRSQKIFKSFKDKRFNYFYADKHSVLYKARNHALSKCKGELIAFLDVDDSWLPEKLSIQVEMFKDPSVGLSCGNYFKIDERKSGNNIKKPMYSSIPSGFVLNELFKEYFPHMSTIIIRKKALVKQKLFFDERFNIIGDLDLVVRLCTKWELASVQQPIAYYRWHQNNTGYDKSMLISEEFNIWINEIKNIPEYSSLTNFKEFEYKVKLYQVLKLLLDGKKKEAISQLYSLKLYHKIKLIISMFLPLAFIKFWINKS